MARKAPRSKRNKISPFWRTVRVTVDQDRDMSQTEVLKQARKFHASSCWVGAR